MKRKLIQMAGKTMVVSLPAEWVKKYGLKKGEEIDLEEKGKNLILSMESKDVETSTQIDITDLSKSLVNRVLISAYKMGFDEIKVTYQKEKVLDIKTKKEIPAITIINDIINIFIGMEVVEQNKGYTIIRQVSKISENEFDTVLRRIFFLLDSMSKEVLNVVKNKDKDLQNIVKQKHDTIEKLTNYCLRLLNKQGYRDYKKTSVFYYLISELEEISDVYNFISIEAIEKKIASSKEVLDLFERVNRSWETFHQVFYKYEKEKLVTIIEDRTHLWEKINKTYQKASSSDLILLGKISIVIIKILNLVEAKMSIQM